MKARCSRCGRYFGSDRACQMHIRDKHKKPAEPVAIAPETDDESMASIFINAEINRAIGEPNEDWIEDMLP